MWQLDNGGQWVRRQWEKSRVNRRNVCNVHKSRALLISTNQHQSSVRLGLIDYHQINSIQLYIYLLARRHTLVVASVVLDAMPLLLKNLGRLLRPLNDILSVCKCSQRWWCHSNSNCCNQICLDFLHPQVVKMLKHLPCTVCVYQWATW